MPFFNANGYFAFNDISYTHHELIVKKADGVQIAVFDLDFTQGGQFRTDVTQTGVNITYTGKEAAINIEFALTKDQNGVKILQVSGSEKPVNDTSGISSNMTFLWIAGGVLATGVVIFFVFFLIKKKRKRETRRY